jgi:tripartite-type tricarboxylate transporter receptor subunit TctC
MQVFDFSKVIRFIKLICCASLMLFSALGAQAQSWPDKPIKLIIPFAAGGTTDILGRIFAQQMTVVLGQNVIVENKGGAGGNIGAEVVAKAPADGYTLLLASGSMLTVNPYMYKKMAINYSKDFAPITTLVSGPMIISVSNQLGVNTLKELIALAKTKNLNFGSAGIGSQVHLAGENFITAAGINATHVPYKGESPALSDLVSGQIDFCACNVPASTGFVKSGQIKALAVTSSKRLSQLPNIPTVSEAAIPGFENLGWFALMAPSGTPKAIREKIYTASIKAVKSDAMQKSLDLNSLTPVLNSTKELETQIETESLRWEKIINARGLTAN